MCPSIFMGLIRVKISAVTTIRLKISKQVFIMITSEIIKSIVKLSRAQLNQSLEIKFVGPIQHLLTI